MTIIGVDYGEKRIGMAVSDATETLAFPKLTLMHSGHLAEDIAEIAAHENARLIVLGESLDLKGNDNALMEGIRELKQKLEAAAGLPIVFEKEFFSSQEAARFQGAGIDIDASAAAIILQRFLDRQRMR